MCWAIDSVALVANYDSQYTNPLEKKIDYLSSMEKKAIDEWIFTESSINGVQEKEDDKKRLKGSMWASCVLHELVKLCGNEETSVILQL